MVNSYFYYSDDIVTGDNVINFEQRGANQCCMIHCFYQHRDVHK